MAELPAAAVDLLRSGHLIWVATADSTGWPNIAIKGSAAYFDDGYLYFADVFSLKTRSNLATNHRVAVGLYDPDTNVAIQIKGYATFLTTGTLYSDVVAELRRKRPKTPDPRHVVQISIDIVYDMGPGPNSGHVMTVMPTGSGM